MDNFQHKGLTALVFAVLFHALSGIFSGFISDHFFFTLAAFGRLPIGAAFFLLGSALLRLRSGAELRSQKQF